MVIFIENVKVNSWKKKYHFFFKLINVKQPGLRAPITTDTSHFLRRFRGREGCLGQWVLLNHGRGMNLCSWAGLCIVQSQMFWWKLSGMLAVGR